MYKEIEGVKVWGDPIDNAVEQAVNCTKTADKVVMMADHHLGYAVPIGGVCAYKDSISPSGVGYDIACGNKAIRLDADSEKVAENIKRIMDDIWGTLSFGVGMKNQIRVENRLFEEDDAWNIPAVNDLKDLARSQLGTIGSGNHYVDIFIDEEDKVWVGVHFGSRGFGHKIATHYLKKLDAPNGMNVDPAVVNINTALGQEYVGAMLLAGRYAYAGRDWVCNVVADIIGANITEEVHNHHNFAWREEHDGEKYWVVRKGSTPAFPGQKGFVGGSMGDNAVIVEGVDSEESKAALYSTVHGAGRVMSRTQAAGKFRWKKGRRIQKSVGDITHGMMHKWIDEFGVELRGAGVDESPHCYKRLPDVLQSHNKTINILHNLKPIGVAMASAGEYDPFKD